MQNVAHKMARIYDGPNPEKVTYKKWRKKNSENHINVRNNNKITEIVTEIVCRIRCRIF